MKSLKSNDMFAVVAAPEIEDAFIQVCGNTSKRELIIALDKILPDLYDQNLSNGSLVSLHF